MATERAQLLLSCCDAARKDVFCGTEGQEAGEAELPGAVMVPYLKDTRRKLKVAQLQLCVMDYMLHLLESMESPDVLNPSILDTGEDGRARLKELKSEHIAGLQQAQEHITALLDRMEQVQLKRERLEQLLAALERKREEVKEKERMKMQNRRAERLNSVRLQELEESLQAGRSALRQSELAILELQAQKDACLAGLDSWALLQDGLQQSVEMRLQFEGCLLRLVGRQEVCVELLPRACRPDLGDLKPLSLSLTLSPDGLFTLQSQGATGVLDESLQGPLTQVSSALEEIIQRYLSEGEMLAEIQGLHQRFAIDWDPVQRMLIFLKTASVVCHLRVEDGYPNRGRASLLSVRKERDCPDISTLQPPQVNPSLTQWLVFLSTCPDL
ncbi:hypothetical protein MATL_G00212530 [Megalops atlanticus]|uniref:Uncharacterized protein n=1 Tax=Megalops atlanticus TaxID=7932 RepID=A0A9D3PKQ7_MEGAT|nr:hypothetical protein MATL_G00212530 [Megalops atlanticus]